MSQRRTADELQAIVDRAQIRATIFRYCVYYDEGNVGGLARLFTEDCRKDYGPERGGEERGRTQLLERLARSQQQYRWTHHQLGDSLIDVHGDEATATTYVLGWHELLSGERCWVGARYCDELRREAGRWLIAARRTVVHGVDGSMADHPWMWLDRKVSGEPTV